MYVFQICRDERSDLTPFGLLAIIQSCTTCTKRSTLHVSHVVDEVSCLEILLRVRISIKHLDVLFTF